MDVLGITSDEFAMRLQSRRPRREVLLKYAAVYRRDEADGDSA